MIRMAGDINEIEVKTQMEANDECSGAFLIFDADCGLCRRFARWASAQDRKHAVTFVPAGTGREITLEDVPASCDNVIFIDESGSWYRSTGIIRLIIRLGGICKLAWLFRLIPGKTRDHVYDLIAHKRHCAFSSRRIFHGESSTKS